MLFCFAILKKEGGCTKIRDSIVFQWVLDPQLATGVQDSTKISIAKIHI